MFRQAILIGCMAAVGGCFAQSAPPQPPVFPGAETPLGATVAALVSEPKVRRAHWGIAVTTLDGTPVFGLNEGEFFQPASNAKLFTTAAAMQLLGPGATVETSAIGGSIFASGGRSKGDLVLTGAGDADISGQQFPYVSSAERKRQSAALRANGEAAPKPDPLRIINEIADSFADQGVKEITGDIVGDDTLWPFEPYARDWTIDDAVWGYGAPASALSIDDNQLAVTVTPGAKAGAAATVSMSPEIGYYTADAHVTTVAAKQPASIRIDREPGSHSVRVVGTVAMGEPYSTEIAIADPAEFAAQALKEALEARGIKVDGVARAKHRLSNDPQEFVPESQKPLPSLPKVPVAPPLTAHGCADACPMRVDHFSPTLADDIRFTLKVSQNLHAELLLRRLGKKFGTDGSTAQGARVVRQFLINAGLDGGDFIFYDGSGLSGHDLVAPRATVTLLAFAAKQPWFAQWKASLPVAGEDGTLASRFAKGPLKDHLFAKTGTLSEARALSGYVDAASGRTLIFSVMVDNHAPNTPADKDVMDRIVEAIAAEN